MPLAMALEEIHFPPTCKNRAVQTRLKFEELLHTTGPFNNGQWLNAHDGILFQKLVLF